VEAVETVKIESAHVNVVEPIAVIEVAKTVEAAKEM
jgi:hypothetical protein